jgi:hypothetical protein
MSGRSEGANELSANGELAMSERDIFTAARGITDPEARAVFLAGACGGDAALRQRVETLLRADATPDSFLDVPVVAPAHPDTAPQEADVRPGTGSKDGSLSFLEPSRARPAPTTRSRSTTRPWPSTAFWSPSTPAPR